MHIVLHLATFSFTKVKNLNKFLTVFEVTKFCQNVKICEIKRSLNVVENNPDSVGLKYSQTWLVPCPIKICQLCTRPIEFSIELNNA
jgi:hypothetical protein